MPPDPSRVKALFAAGLDLPPGERAAFLERECGADLALRERLEALLAAHDGAPTADAPPPPPATRTAPARPTPHGSVSPAR